MHLSVFAVETTMLNWKTHNTPTVYLLCILVYLLFSTVRVTQGKWTGVASYRRTPSAVDRAAVVGRGGRVTIAQGVRGHVHPRSLFTPRNPYAW